MRRVSLRRSVFCRGRCCFGGHLTKQLPLRSYLFLRFCWDIPKDRFIPFWSVGHHWVHRCRLHICIWSWGYKGLLFSFLLCFRLWSSFHLYYRKQRSFLYYLFWVSLIFCCRECYIFEKGNARKEGRRLLEYHCRSILRSSWGEGF